MALKSSPPGKARFTGGYLIAFLCLFGLAPQSLAAQQSTGSFLEDLDRYIEEAMESWHVPGLAVAVVKDDEIVIQKGYGVLRAGDGGRQVDENTLFGIGSTTKAMTAAALGILVDEGLLQWDDKVVDHLPDFRLYDPWISEQVTIRDLLAHRVGVGRMIGNRIQYMTKEPRAELIRRMRYLPPERPFREAHVYQNVMYMVAGEIIPAVTGSSWDDFLQERIFVPLRMGSTNTSIHDFQPGDPIAFPHFHDGEHLMVIPHRDIDNVGPAGSVNSSVAEMAQWVRLQLGRGEFGGERIFSEEVWREMHRPQIALPGTDPLEGLSAYGLGWRLTDYHGRLMSQHGGGIDGMTTALFLVPEERIGVIVLSNLLPHSLATAVARVLVDREMGLPFHDWSDELLAQSMASSERARELGHEFRLRRADATEPSLPLTEYVGAYEDELYGRADVYLEDGVLRLRFWGDDDAILRLEHWHYDTFRAVWPNPFHGEKFVWFSLDKAGVVGDLSVEWNLRPPPSGYVRVTRFDRTTAP